MVEVYLFSLERTDEAGVRASPLELEAHQPDGCSTATTLESVDDDSEYYVQEHHVDHHERRQVVPVPVEVQSPGEAFFERDPLHHVADAPRRPRALGDPQLPAQALS